MRGAVLHAPRDIRVEDRDDPAIEKPTDVIIRLAATCVCGSDLWSYRGVEPVSGPAPMGHEYAGVVEDIGSDVRIGLAIPASAEVDVMGRPELTKLYAAAVSLAGRTAVELDGEQSFIAGITEIAKRIDK